MKARQPRQLLLGFQLDAAATLDSFLPATQDQQLLQHLQQVASLHGEQLTFIWGRPGTGKTHLLQALCHELATVDGAPIYIPLARSGGLAPELLEGLEHLDLVCLDDIDAVAGQPDWEQALFHFYNRAREQQTRLVVSATTPPASLGLALADLRSRLQSGVVFQVHELSDAEKSRLLTWRAEGLGIRLPDAVVSYVLGRHDRSPAALIRLLQELDRRSLEQQRPITVPLVREIMNW